jgi:hypothetical protein
MKSQTGPGPSMPRELEGLRTMLDARLTALEAALADPEQHGSLERVILDLARVATQEADAAARQAYLDAQREGQGAIAAAQAEGRTALEAEQSAAAALRTELGKAHAALLEERAAGAAGERDLAALRQALEQEQSARSRLRRELEEGQAALETERTAVAALQQGLEQAKAAHQAEGAAGLARARDVAAVQQALEHELKREQTEHAKVRTKLEAAWGASEVDRAKTHTDLDQAVRDAETRAETAIRERQTLLGDVDAVRQAAAAAVADAQARYEKLRDGTDQQIRALELAAREADARAASAERERDLLRHEAKPQTRDASPPREPAAKAVHAPVAPPPPEAAPPPDGPVRAAKRVAISGEVDIQIDGHPSKLIDLSTTGAQILSPGALKPNRLVTITLPLGDGRLSCKGKIMWSRLEPARKSGQLSYRAGVSFTSADLAALEAFLSQVSSKE